MKLILYRINRVRISDFHYLYNETSMETRSKEEKSAQFAYGISLTSNFIFVFHISANPCDGMTCQNNGTCLVSMADGTHSVVVHQDLRERIVKTQVRI